MNAGSLFCASLFLPPLALAALYIYSFLKRREALNKFCNSGLTSQPKIAPGAKRTVWGGLSMFSALVLFILPLAEYGWKTPKNAAPLSTPEEIMIVLDVSPSMEAQDIRPSRLKCAKQAAGSLIVAGRYCTIGIIAFSGRSVLLSPPTTDRDTLESRLQATGSNDIPVHGTSLGLAIEQAAAVLSASSDKINRKIVIFSDGEDHGGGIDDALRKATKKRITVSTVGVGTLKGGLIPESDGTGRFKRDGADRFVISKLNAPLLKRVAGSTGGVYFDVNNMDASKLLADGKEGTGESRVSSRNGSRYQWFLAGGLLCFISGIRLST